MKMSTTILIYFVIALVSIKWSTEIKRDHMIIEFCGECEGRMKDCETKTDVIYACMNGKWVKLDRGRSNH